MPNTTDPANFNGALCGEDDSQECVPSNLAVIEFTSRGTQSVTAGLRVIGRIDDVLACPVAGNENARLVVEAELRG